MKIRPVLAFILAGVIAIISCKKTVYINPVHPTDYFIPLQVGKYALYRLDSLNFYFYGQLDTTTSYLAKDSVEASFTDGTGDTAWRVVRYQANINTPTVWVPSQTYVVTPSLQRVEVTENNLRYVKLAFPVDEGFTWLGNTYLPYNPYKDFFSYSDDSHLDLSLWNFSYKNVNTTLTVNGKKYDSTITVLSAADSLNVPIVDDSTFGSMTYWSETYAKHIGLISRSTKLYEYQPPTPDGTQHGYKIGFQMVMTLLDHN